MLRIQPKTAKSKEYQRGHLRPPRYAQAALAMHRLPTEAARPPSLCTIQTGTARSPSNMHRIPTGEARSPSICTEYQRGQLGHSRYAKNSNATLAMRKIQTGAARQLLALHRIPTVAANGSSYYAKKTNGGQLGHPRYMNR